MKQLRIITASALLLCASMATPQKYVGGDISLLKKFVDEGAVYKDKDGQTVEPYAFFRQTGWNAMRLRLFVDPAKASSQHRKEGVIQDLEYVTAMAKDIKAAGFQLMIDFHYSDTWTDPGQHSTPEAWSTLSVTEMTTKVYDYTKECLQQLVKADAAPDFIQVGNEITVGMLWPTGKVYASGGAPGGGSWNNLAGYLDSGLKACREICPQAKTIIHVEMHAPADVPKFYVQLAQYPDVRYDIIGLSYYPDHHGDLDVLNATLTTLESQQADKTIMIVETGYGFEWQLKDAKYNFASTWPLSESGQQQFTADLIATLKTHPNVNGLFWWYPEYTLNNIVFKNGSEIWADDFTSGYWNAALFHYKTGRALPALYELKNFNDGIAGISQLTTDNKTDEAWYLLNGMRLAKKPSTEGIYIKNGKKTIVR